MKTYQYQLNVYASCFLLSLYGTGTSCGCALSAHFGRFWFLFPVGTIVYNDVMAFFAGSMFGRTKLISLSPNKTWEGFFGAVFFNLISTWYQTTHYVSEYWYCHDYTIELAPYRPITCEIPSIYDQNSYTMPYKIPGMEGPISFKLSKATIVGCIFCVFSSLIAPFMGFLGSGLKRAFHVKDFATTLPGHGGFADRYDCITFSCIFTYVAI
jgi:phosphatidate cytidylyltransferase